MIDVEIFACTGGMAEGFRRSGITFHLAVDLARDHCDSYEANLGHRPVQMDVRDLLRLVRLGGQPRVRLLVADPPCTPWSRAGKRRGQADERDMLADTVELIALLRPQAYLIGNVPGLEDGNHLPIVQEAIGGLSRFGYCVADFAALDAANYGVPQHRVRPFWYGHLHGPCIRWPHPTHGDPGDCRDTLPGMAPLQPWRTCRDALGHLTLRELGRVVKIQRRRACNGLQHGSVPERPARVVGTSNLSDGNVLLMPKAGKSGGHQPSYLDQPAKTVRASDGGGAKRALVLNERHEPAQLGLPAPTMLAKYRGNSAQMLALDGRHKLPQSARLVDYDRPADTVQVREDRLGSGMTVAIPAPPAPRGKGKKAPPLRAVLLSEKAAKILHGFPDDWVIAGTTKRARWSQIGQAMPPPLAHAVGRAVAEQLAATTDELPAERFVAWVPPPPRGVSTPAEQVALPLLEAAS